MGLDIERIFGEQRLTQDEKLKKRKDRIRQLRRERAKQGLSTDMDEIEKQVEAEEKAEKQKRTVRLPEMFKNVANYCLELHYFAVCWHVLKNLFVNPSRV